MQEHWFASRNSLQMEDAGLDKFFLTCGLKLMSESSIIPKCDIWQKQSKAIFRVTDGTERTEQNDIWLLTLRKFCAIERLISLEMFSLLSMYLFFLSQTESIF